MFHDYIKYNKSNNFKRSCIKWIKILRQTIPCINKVSRLTNWDICNSATPLVLEFYWFLMCFYRIFAESHLRKAHYSGIFAKMMTKLSDNFAHPHLNSIGFDMKKDDKNWHITIGFRCYCKSNQGNGRNFFGNIVLKAQFFSKFHKILKKKKKKNLNFNF